MVPVAGRAVVTTGMGAVAVAARFPGHGQEIEATDRPPPWDRRHGRSDLSHRVSDRYCVRTSNGRRGDHSWVVREVAVRLVA